MKLSESWLRTFINTELTTNELSHALTMSGLEVESITKVIPQISKVVVGRVIEVSKHPNLDKLNICQIDIGISELLNIICAAKNISPGVKVPVALVGAKLPPIKDGEKSLVIKLLKLHGIKSQGMLCSGFDLKLSEDQVNVLILQEDMPIGQDICDALNLNDVIFEIKLTPNRADCLSVLGIAREISAITGEPLIPININPAQVKLDDIFPVKIIEKNLCGRFSGRVIRGVNARAKTPYWMIERLERSGQRSVSVLIDISNYVMFEVGQPSHLFDLDKINGGIYIRWGKNGESIKLLNGNTVEIDDKVGVIADASKIESLAAIMGGNSTAITLDTINIYLESAFWLPDSIQGRARRYNLSTDAAHRFERGVDYVTTVKYIERITQLILDICGGDAGPIDDHVVNIPQRLPIEMRISKVNRTICALLNAEDIARIFFSLGMSFKQNGDVFLVTPPSYRFDIEIEEDLIEEVARIYGFEKIPERLPISTSKMRITQETRRSIHDVRHMLSARDYSETISFSFVSPELERDFSGNDKSIRLINPISSQFSVMRSTLFCSLISVLLYNLKRREERVRVFEMGSVFIADSSVKATETTVEGYLESKRVGALAYGPALDLQWGTPVRTVDFFDVKGDLESLLFPSTMYFVKAKHPALHPGRSAKISIDDCIEVGWIGELNPKLMQKYELLHAPILFEIDTNALILRKFPIVSNMSKFPLVQRDISVIVNETIEVQALLDDMKQAIKEDTCRFVKRITLFDQFFFKKTVSDVLAAKEKSLTFRITLQDLEGTLQDDMIDKAIHFLLDKMKDRHGARLRSS
ncbi:MAG: phenylalanine--tRNA ligase subunit beta [Burkholderia sp.]|nr:phenylalanine--tRNA ligase subunit beta [Burkholderia sp.]